MDNGEAPEIKLYNTLTRSKAPFAPIDPSNVRVYVCGPTVYDFAHIGNARPVIVFDVLFRLLRHVYGENHVTYVRNITDVDDKINARALRDFPGLDLNEAIRRVTETTAAQFHRDVDALGCLPPTVEPRATEYVLPRPDGKADMVSLIQALIDRGHAYESNGEILFDIASMADYGKLSNRKLEEQQAGARVAVDAHKKSPGDFVLWKESSDEEPGWAAEFRLPGRTVAIRGRPGWHIECSAMSAAYLGEVFDIHGGGLDLIFPHHENEIAQSRCAHGTSVMANVWMHNGFLQVEGRKMSKSEGNFVTIHDLLETDAFGGRKWPGEVLRLAMLMTHYREPIDFSVARLEEAESRLSKWKRFAALRSEYRLNRIAWNHFLDALYDDLNTTEAFAVLDRLSDSGTGNERNNYTVYKAIKTLGFKNKRSRVATAQNHLEDFINVISKLSDNDWKNIWLTSINNSRFKSGTIRPETKMVASLRAITEAVLPKIPSQESEDVWKIHTQVVSRLRNNWDRVQDPIEAKIKERLALIREKNWPEADRIREELAEKGIQLKDGKDPATGERVTTWEVKR